MNSGHVVRSLRPAATTMAGCHSHRRRYSVCQALPAGLEQNRTGQNFPSIALCYSRYSAELPARWFGSLSVALRGRARSLLQIGTVVNRVPDDAPHRPRRRDSPRQRLGCSSWAATRPLAARCPLAKPSAGA